MVLAMALFLLIPVGPGIQAKANKVSASVNWKKAPALQSGKNLLKVKKEDSYTFFKAPKKGTYKVTFYGLQGLDEKTKNKTVAGFTSYTYDKKAKKLYYIKGSHKGTKDTGFVFSTSWLIKNRKKYQSEGWVDTCTVKYSLKKGQRLYFMMYGDPNRFRVGVKIA